MKSRGEDMTCRSTAGLPKVISVASRHPAPGHLRSPGTGARGYARGHSTLLGHASLQREQRKASTSLLTRAPTAPHANNELAEQKGGTRAALATAPFGLEVRQDDARSQVETIQTATVCPDLRSGRPSLP